MIAATVTRSSAPVSLGAAMSAPAFVQLRRGRDDRMKVGRVIRTADERARGDMREPLRAGDLAVSFEAFRRNEFHHRQMVRAWSQILAHRQNLTADLTQIVHRLEKFRFFFAEP